MVELNEKQKKNLKDYFNKLCPTYKKSEEFEEHKNVVLDRISYFRRELPKKIDDISEIDLVEILSNTWAISRTWGNVQSRAQKIIADNGIKKIKEAFKILLDTSIPPHKRYGKVLKMIKGLGPASITEILAYIHPHKCSIWNIKAREALDILNISIINTKKDKLTPQEYKTYNKLVKTIQEELNFQKSKMEDIGLFLTDFFFFEVSQQGEKPEVSQKSDQKPGGFYDFIESKGFYFEPEIVEDFLLSIKVKPFVILTGNSGTGKTKLAQLYGEYISDDEKRYLMVPVGANWTEKRHIFGYLNIMTGEYQSTPALDFIMKARKDPDNPYLLILDEMNLSHVERYFSDFLSAIESGEPIPLNPECDFPQEHDNPECDFPQKIEIPENLIVVGTVNVDETTYMFSPKVLDRANTIEFETTNPKKYLTNQPKQELKGDLKFLENPLNHNIETAKIKEDLNPILDQITDELEFFYKELKGSGFDFGFRVVNEILSFMHAAWIYQGKPQEWNNWKRYFDAQIKQKILPKIHGPERLLRDTLQKLKEHCKEKFPNSEKKLEEMEETLKAQRYVSFIK